ncbi:MAG: hypothetical protein ACPGSC_00420, partial [Granulosicoccaceae bacterium]
RWFLYDVTNADADQVKLVRRGKYDANSTNWDELGLAIAKAAPIVYRLSGDNTSVRRHGLLYPNGWDPAAEFDYLTPSTMGRGLSMYNLDSGAPLWKMNVRHGASNMKYAFATEPTTVDLNGDGYTDLIYAVDVNARVWRFNVDQNASSAANLIDGGMLANLGTDLNIKAEQRRTYRRIDAAAINAGNGVEVLLAIGTGDRMNPTLSDTQDRLLVIRDKSAGSGAKPTTVLKESNLYNATDNTLGEGGDTAKRNAQTALNGSDGWYIDLPADQKAISAPLISSGIANFAVYQVGGTASNPCEDNSMGSGLLYRVNVLDATPVTDMDGSGGLTKNDRFTSIRGGGIPGDVGFHTSPTGIKTIIVNRDTFVNNPDEFNPERPQTPEDEFHGDSAGYWFEKER